MAANVICDGPDDEPAAYVVTALAEAETVAMCTGCYVDFSVAFLTALAPNALATPEPKPARARKPRSNAAAGAASGEQVNGESAAVV